jgi:hypothetical protein
MTCCRSIAGSAFDLIQQEVKSAREKGLKARLLVP